MPIPAAFASGRWFHHDIGGRCLDCPADGYAPVPPPGPLVALGFACPYQRWSGIIQASIADGWRPSRTNARPGCFRNSFLAVARGEQVVSVKIEHDGPDLLSTADGSLRLMDYSGGLAFAIHGEQAAKIVLPFLESHPFISVGASPIGAARSHDEKGVLLVDAWEDHLAEISLCRDGSHRCTWWTPASEPQTAAA